MVRQRSLTALIFSISTTPFDSPSLLRRGIMGEVGLINFLFIPQNFNLSFYFRNYILNFI
jgi:hypothetical protein